MRDWSKFAWKKGDVLTNSSGFKVFFDKWSIDFFSYKVPNGYICTGDAWFGYCLPYNEETAHLLGTTDDWEGGEQ